MLSSVRLNRWSEKLLASDAFVSGEEPIFRLENLPRQLQFPPGRESFVEFFYVAISHVISLRRLVYTGDAVKVWGNISKVPSVCGNISKAFSITYSASFGQFLTHSIHRIHSVPFRRFLLLSVTSTFIGHTFLHFPQETHLSLSHLIRSSEK